MKLIINAKCSDMFWARLLDINGRQVGTDYDGYVPDWMPGENYGDFVELEIDIATGNILNWHCPTRAQLAETFKFKRGVAVPKPG
jgi:hypothetical protein